jgi:hypothetical protein
MAMTVDFSDFKKRFRTLVENAVPAEAEKGLYKAANELLHDAIYERPYAPFDEGHLRGSARTTAAEITGDSISTKAGFNIVYAARWHELSPAEDARISWTLPGSGRKYLESKLVFFMRKYMEIVAEHIKNLLGK